MSEDPRPVFDTSSVVAVLLDDDTPLISVLYDGHVLDSTRPETCSGRSTGFRNERLWRSTELVSSLGDLRRGLVVYDLDEIGFEVVMEIATETELTFYDAGYIACAEAIGAMLVMEDAELLEVAEERTDAQRVREYRC